MKITIHQTANINSLSYTRVYIFLIWLFWFVSDKSYVAANADMSIFYKHGVMKLFSDDFFYAITPGILLLVKCITIYFICAVIVGLNKSKWYLFISVILITFYMGYVRGFAHYVSHREMTLLYCTYILLILPSYDSLKEKVDVRESNNGIYRASMVVLSLLIVLDYFFIGVARLCSGSPLVFHPEVMRQWLVAHAFSANEWNFQYGALVLDYPWLKYVVFPMLPISTVLEILAPIALFSSNTVRVWIVALLIAFHVGIFFLMNLLFIENILLLFLLLDFTKTIDYLRQKFDHLYERMVLSFNKSIEK